MVLVSIEARTVHGKHRDLLTNGFFFLRSGVAPFKELQKEVRRQRVVYTH